MAANLSPDEQARFDSLYGTEPTEAAPTGPGVFTGSYKGLAGVPSGLSGAALSLASSFTAPTNEDGQDMFTPIDLAKEVLHPGIEQLRQDTAEYYRPDPQTTGFVGNTLFGATDVITRIGASNLLAPGSGLAVAAGTTGFERTKDLEAQGVDSQTAQASGALTGVSLLAMGGVANAFGKTLAMRALTGAGSNVAFGAGTRGTDSALLNANGYHAQAEQQKWNDGTAIAADMIIGAGFGLLPHGGKPTADQVDAALTAKSAQNVDDLAPGAAVNARSAAAHVDALDTAQAQVMDGQPVDVEPIIKGAQFVERAATHEPAATTLLTDNSPAVADGFTRLYRGEHAEQDRNVFITGDVNDGKVGGWFTPDIEIAKSFKDTQEQGRKGPNKSGRLVYVDVPNDQLSKYQTEGTALGNDPIRRGENSFFIPSLRRDNVIEPGTSVSSMLHQALTDNGALPGDLAPVDGGYPAYRRALESGGRADAANPNSSALGADQFVDSTWLNIVKQSAPDWAKGLDDKQLLALRTDPEKSGQMAAALDQQNATALAQAGVQVDNHTLYAAHHFGPAKAIEFANAADDAPMSSILSPEQMKANPYLGGKTKAETVANWDARGRLAGVFHDSEMHAPNFGLPEAPKTIPDHDPIWQAIPEGENGRETVNIDTPERVQLRDSIVDEHFADLPVPDLSDGARPIAYVMGGGGASGKGTVLKFLRRTGAIPDDGMVHIDPDAIKESIPEYNAMLDRGDSRAAATVHEESSGIAKAVLAKALAGKYNLVLDRTLGNKGKALAEISALKKAGYVVKLYGVTVDPRLAVGRAVERAKGSGRFVPLDKLLEAHKGFADGFEDYAGKVDQVHLFDNNVDRGQVPRELANGTGGRFTVHDQAGYNRFRGRSQINEQAKTLAEIGPEKADVRAGERTDPQGSATGRNGEAAPGARGRGERSRSEAGLEADQVTSTAATAAAAPALSPADFPLQGNASQVVTERGMVVPVRWAVVDASTLVTSHSDSLKANPDFPAELQPRDRARAASEQQITKISNAINPELLAESPKAADGAPIIGTDKVVESGNARTIALRRAFSKGKADGYVRWLNANAQHFGIDPAGLKGVEHPVLVRVAEGGHDRAEFARQANESSVAAMSQTEQAGSDAARMPDLSTMVPNDDGTINLSASAKFISQFVEAMPPSERGQMIGGDGRLSQQGLTRIRNAVFAKAYGDPELVAMLTESTDANVKNMLAGMMKAAPQIAKLRASIAEGGAHPIDIAPELVAAVRKFSQLRSQGETVKGFLEQRDMFGGDSDPVLNNWLLALDENSRAPKRIADLITRQVQAVEAMGHPGQGDVFGGTGPTSDKAGVLQSAVEGIRSEYNVKPSGSLFSANGKPTEQARGVESGHAAEAQAGTDTTTAGAGRPQSRAAGADASVEQRAGLDPARAGEVERARQAVETRPDEVLNDGTTAREAMASADAEVHQAETQGEAIKAAVACFLRFGADVA